MANSILTPLQITAGEGLLQNQGLAVSATFIAAIDTYDNSTLIAPLRSAMLAAGNVYPDLFTIGASTCPALGDSVPAAYTLSTSPTGWVDTFEPIGNLYLGSGDLSKFAQAESLCQSYADTANQFINSAVNSQTYLANTFSNVDNMITGEITSVNRSVDQFGQDLTNLGNLINLDNLDNLGSPLALTQQLAAVGGITTDVAVAFTAAGVPLEVVLNINDPALSTIDSTQRLMYTAMTKITGASLAEVLTILQVKTAGIETMADLLNPYKIFPISFQTLTVTSTAGVSERIYSDNQGTVNMVIAQGLPDMVLSDL
jgi:hypothetical protein